MRFFSIPIDITTVTVAAVALGIAVDDTIHIMIHFRQKRMENAPFEESVKWALRTVSAPVIVTSVIIGFGFATLTLSEFLPIRHFGILMCVTIFTALIFDLIVTPVVMKFSDKHAAPNRSH